MDGPFGRVAPVEPPRRDELEVDAFLDYAALKEFGGFVVEFLKDRLEPTSFEQSECSLVGGRLCCRNRTVRACTGFCWSRGRGNGFVDDERRCVCRIDGVGGVAGGMNAMFLVRAR